MDALGPFIINSEKVVNLAVSGIPRSPETHPDRLGRMALKRPVEHVDVVNVLLHDVVAAQPREAVPIVHLISDVTHAWLARPLPKNALVPVAASTDQLPDGPVVDSLDGVDVGCLVTPLRAGNDSEVLSLGLFVSRQHLADTGTVHADRLLGEDRFACGNSRLQVE